MKVILLDNIRKVGQKGDIIEVSDGYARNFLIKNGKAKPAIGGNLKVVQEKKKIKEQKQKEEEKKNEELFQKINKQFLVLKQNASEKGHLFASVHKKDIAKIISDFVNNEVEVKEKNIILENDIKELGEYKIKIKLGKLLAKITLKVEKL